MEVGEGNMMAKPLAVITLSAALEHAAKIVKLLK